MLNAKINRRNLCFMLSYENIKNYVGSQFLKLLRVSVLNYNKDYIFVKVINFPVFCSVKYVDCNFKKDTQKTGLLITIK